MPRPPVVVYSFDIKAYVAYTLSVVHTVDYQLLPAVIGTPGANHLEAGADPNDEKQVHQRVAAAKF